MVKKRSLAICTRTDEYCSQDIHSKNLYIVEVDGNERRERDSKRARVNMENGNINTTGEVFEQYVM